MSTPLGSKRRRKTRMRVNDDSEYVAAGITPNYVDSNGISRPFKVIWLGSTVSLSLIGAWMIYNKESSTGYAGGSKYLPSSGKPHTINGYNVLFAAVFMALFSILIFWPRKKAAQGASK